MGISSYSTTAASNTTISGISIAEGCAPSGINDAIRQMMADLATFSNGQTVLNSAGSQTTATFCQVANNLSDVTAATARTNLGLGTSAIVNTGTSGATIPLLNAANTWGAAQALGSSTATTQSAGDNSTKVATTAYADAKSTIIVGGTDGTSVTAGSTVYIFSGSSATENTMSTPLPACTLKNLRVISNVAAGSGKNFTFTGRKNGVNTAQTCAISGASSTSASDTSHTVSYSAGDAISLQLVTDAGAATATFAFCLEATIP